MVNAIGIVKKLRPGDDLDTYCGRCKEEREHAIVALNAQGGVERVQCRTCQSNHLYRAPKTTRTRSTKEKSAASVVETGPARAYSMQTRFRVGERIAHPKFGVGTVIDERYGKIDVRFGKEMRTLIHAS